MFRRLIGAISIVVLVVAAAACNGSSTSTSPTASTSTPAPSVPSTPAPETKTNAELELGGSYVCTNSFCDFAVFSLELTNTGGVGANLNFIRIENRNGQPIQELGADHFINAFGTNRLEAGQTLSFTLTAQLGYALVIGYRDDNGVRAEVTWLIPGLPR